MTVPAVSRRAQTSGVDITLPHDDHPQYGLSVQVGDHHYINARRNPVDFPGGWRVEDSRPGNLRVLVRACTREQAYALVAEMADAVAGIETAVAA